MLNVCIFYLITSLSVLCVSVLFDANWLHGYYEMCNIKVKFTKGSLHNHGTYGSTLAIKNVRNKL